MRAQDLARLPFRLEEIKLCDNGGCHTMHLHHTPTTFHMRWAHLQIGRAPTWFPSRGGAAGIPLQGADRARVRPWGGHR
jgi:hypothetical protein